MNRRIIFVILLITLSAGYAHTQTSELYSFNRLGFIENKDKLGVQSKSAPYRTDINGLTVEFTRRGLHYYVEGRLRKRVKGKYEPNLDDGPTHRIIEFNEDFSVFFVEPSDSLYIEALDLRSNYVIQHRKVKEECYDRVVYRNEWPKIDIEFTIP